ncbi:MAG TPA: hypothetical protein VHG27_07925 [Xanthobacteraceae bacterium]|nr:hypothetical protein [Xanthobacteraceae bacterium]
MAGEIKRMNWLRKPSAWETAQAWREQRRIMVERFQAEAQSASASFGSAWSSQIAGVGELAIKMASARLEAAAKAKLDTLA